MEGIGVTTGRSSPCIFHHKDRDIRAVVHGDDFTLCGLEEDLVWIREWMKSWFEIKLRAMLGPDEKDDKEVILLGRRVGWLEDRIEWEADPNHRRKILAHFGMDEGTRALNCNGEKNVKEEEGDEEELSKEEAKIYRGLAARFKFYESRLPRSAVSHKAMQQRNGQAHQRILETFEEGGTIFDECGECSVDFRVAGGTQFFTYSG